MHNLERKGDMVSAREKDVASIKVKPDENLRSSLPMWIDGKSLL